MIKIDHLTFTYPGASRPALQGVNLQVADGELCLVMGPSGGGKSTLLRCINGLVPHFSGGSLTGKIQVDGLDPVQLSPREMSQTVGFVFQDPEAQFVVDRVEDEVAFALENASIQPDEMDARIKQVLALLELTPLRTRKLESLSGGERQRVAIAAALALRPHILILDEPTSQLDPHGAEEVLECLMQLNKKPGLTILLAEHRLERVLPFAGQVIYLSEEYPGGVAGLPREVLNKVSLNPPIITLGKAFGWQPLPLTIAEALECVKRSPGLLQAASTFQDLKADEGVKGHGTAIIQAKGVHVYYDRTHALRGVDLDLLPGEITVLMGSNGSGKTTLVRSLIGLVPIQEGSISINGKDIAGRAVADICQQVGYLPQNPNALLFADTVLEELQITLHNHHLEPKDLGIEPGGLLEKLKLTDKAGTYPRDLSTGERQRAALGAMIVTHPEVLLLDEPTRGLDYEAKKILLGLLQDWRNEGMAILLVTHDVELAVQAADRVIILEAGHISADGDPKEILPTSSVFSPQVARIFPGRGWLTVNDAIRGVNASQY